MNWERVASAALHPAQRAILEYLDTHGQASPVQMTRALGVDLSLSSYAYHVQRLSDLGLIREVGTRPRRGAVEHFYALTP